jgi:outer membrane protein assembly factor BamD
MRAWRRAALCAAVAGLLVGCSSSPKDPKSGTADLDKLYAEAKDDLSNGSYDRAIKALEKLEARTSGTLMGQQALLDMSYAQWRSGERVQALATVDRFIKLHPSSPALDYAYYLRGIINFNDNLGILGSLARQNLSERDQRASRDAYQSFRQLVDQFPTSKYSAEARGRMDYIVNALADYEVHVARYYFRRGAFLAAANRARQAVVDFERSPATEEALYIMAQSYDKLGLTDLRDDADRVLRKNFPTTRFHAMGIGAATDKPWWQLW